MMSKAECQDFTRQSTVIIIRSRNKNESNKTASRITEEVTKADQLLDDFLLEIQETELNKNLSSRTLTERQAKLLDGGKEIRKQAQSRSTKSTGQTQTVLKKRKRSEDDSDWSDWTKEMSKEMHEQKKILIQELEIRNREFELQEKK